MIKVRKVKNPSNYIETYFRLGNLKGKNVLLHDSAGNIIDGIFGILPEKIQDINKSEYRVTYSTSWKDWHVKKFYLTDIESIEGNNIYLKKIRKNPSVDVNKLKSRLIHLLTEYDIKLSKRQPNMYRLGHYFKAVDDAFDDLPNDATINDLKKSLSRRFIVSDMPPVKKFIKDLDQL